MSIILGRGHRLLSVRALLAQRNGGEQENLSSAPWISSRFPIATSRKDDPTGTVMGRSQGITSTSSRILQEEMQEEVLLWYSRPVHSRREVPQEHD